MKLEHSMPIKIPGKKRRIAISPVGRARNECSKTSRTNHHISRRMTDFGGASAAANTRARSGASPEPN
jgi:hypothetical protein